MVRASINEGTHVWTEEMKDGSKLEVELEWKKEKKNKGSRNEKGRKDCRRTIKTRDNGTDQVE